MKKISVVREWFQLLTVVLVTCDKKARSPGNPVGEEAVEEPEEREGTKKTRPSKSVLSNAHRNSWRLEQQRACTGLHPGLCA